MLTVSLELVRSVLKTDTYGCGASSAKYCFHAATGARGTMPITIVPTSANIVSRIVNGVTAPRQVAGFFNRERFKAIVS